MNRKTGILAAVLIFLCIAAGIVFHTHKPQTEAGNKKIDITVIHGDNSETNFIYHTDAEYLAEVLLENGLADGEQSSYGLFIQTVDGETANNSEQQWWCITKGGEQVNSGADTLPIADGDCFELTLMEGY